MPPPTASSAPPRSRHFPHIPVFIVENHNDVLEFIYRCLGARYLPFQNVALLHFDAHPDMTVPRDMPATHTRDKSQLLAALSIENWIMPACYAGHFDRLVWCKPPWARQMPAGEQRFTIGDYAGVLAVSCALEYFVSEGSYRPAADLANGRPVRLRTIELPLSGDDETGDIATVAGDLQTGPFVLDIDLDFFSTHNPFRDLYPKAQAYDRLLDIFEYERVANKDCDDDVAEPPHALHCSRERLNQLDDLERIFQHLQRNGGHLTGITAACDSVQRVWPLLTELCERLRDNYACADIDWMLVYNAGCTRDSVGGDLPHHESTASELDEMVGHFERMLRGLQPAAVPTVITVARSSLDDYCPAEQVDDIQQRVWQALTRVYGERLAAKPILYYADEEWTL